MDADESKTIIKGSCFSGAQNMIHAELFRSVLISIYPGTDLSGTPTQCELHNGPEQLCKVRWFETAGVFIKHSVGLENSRTEFKKKNHILKVEKKEAGRLQQRSAFSVTYNTTY